MHQLTAPQRTKATVLLPCLGFYCVHCLRFSSPLVHQPFGTWHESQFFHCVSWRDQAALSPNPRGRSLSPGGCGMGDLLYLTVLTLPRLRTSPTGGCWASKTHSQLEGLGNTVCPAHRQWSLKACGETKELRTCLSISVFHHFSFQISRDPEAAPGFPSLREHQLHTPCPTVLCLHRSALCMQDKPQNYLRG